MPIESGPVVRTSVHWLSLLENEQQASSLTDSGGTAMYRDYDDFLLFESQIWQENGWLPVAADHCVSLASQRSSM